VKAFSPNKGGYFIQQIVTELWLRISIFTHCSDSHLLYSKFIKKNMSQLILVRHGQSIYNLQNRFTGWLDVPLSPLGKEEAHLAGEKLKKFHLDIAYTSKLVRAWETLIIILEETNQNNIQIVKNVALNERNYGSLQGLNKAETAQKYGEKQVEIWRRSYAVRPPDGESLEDTYNRTVPYYKLEVEPKLKAGKTVLIVAHGNSLRALKMYLENIDSHAIEAINISTGTPRVYDFDEKMMLANVRYL
jgi:2,3-bisphosphoglycerate-dependent phosphoglycerate mutase